MSAIFGETLVFKQGNGGSPIELVVFGDEFYARYETTDGYTVVYDTDKELYCYALVVGGRFVSSGAPIDKPVPPGIKRHLKESPTIRNERFNKRFSKMMPPVPPMAGHHMRTLGVNEGLLPGRRVSEGKVKGLTLLVEFADLQTSITVNDVDALLNGENYRRNGNFCSVREYFQLMSGGKLNYSNTVVGPVRLSRKQDYYRSHLFIEEAMEIAVNEFHIDLSQFDSREQGIVDALNFMYAGRTVYDGELWPHNFHKELTFGQVKTHFYMLSSLGRSAVDLSIGTFCHENGHQLCRFPDIYDYGGRDGDFEKSQGMGRYCLMASGNHLDRGRTPSPINAYFRHLVGWPSNYISLNSSAGFEAKHGDYQTILKYDTDKANEYFIIENRSQLGLDTHLPASGLAVYHCDILGSNEWQEGTREKHYQCALLQADGHLDLENNRNSGDEGDLFADKEGVALSHDTTPSSREWDGSDSGLSLYDISAPGETIRFQVGKQQERLLVKKETVPDLLIPDNDPKGITNAITVEQTGKVKSVKVSVDIIHTYIGDLKVELEAPSGKKALLHNREGSSGDDLHATYSSDSSQPLKKLVGGALAGDWKLNVCDLEGQDTGRLNHWSLEIEYEAAGKVAKGEAAPNMPIPDNQAQGISNKITIGKSGHLQEIIVGVEITHTYIGDLIVELAAPSGQTVILHNRGGESRNDLKLTYDRSLVPDLDVLLGKQIKGDWVLRVRDLAQEDEGTLEKWSLTLTYNNT